MSTKVAVNFPPHLNGRRRCGGNNNPRHISQAGNGRHGDRRGLGGGQGGNNPLAMFFGVDTSDPTHRSSNKEFRRMRPKGMDSGFGIRNRSGAGSGYGGHGQGRNGEGYG